MPVDLDKVKALRERAGLTFEEAAKLASMRSRQHWYKFESGITPDPRVSTLERVALALGVSPCELLKEVPKRRPVSKGARPSAGGRGRAVP